MRRIPGIATLLALTVTAALSLSCSADNPAKPIYECFSCPLAPTTRVHVLTNLESAYNQRRIDWYGDVLDANFTFFLSPGDVGGGLPEQWDRATEVGIHTRLFDKNYTTLPCQSIFLDVRTEDGVEWTGFNPASAPTETWYSTTVYYDYKFEIAPNTYIPLPGSKAAFTVRNAGTESAPHWQLVELRDLGGSTFNLTRTSGTEPTDWGQIKALYR